MTKERIAKLRAKMEEAKLDAFWVTAPAEANDRQLSANRRYMSGFSGSLGNLLITRDDAFIAVDFRYWEQAEREAPDYTLFKVEGAWKDWYPKLLGESGVTGKRIGFQPADVSVAQFQAMNKAIKELPKDDQPKLLSAPPFIEQLRSIKDAAEIAAVQEAVDLGDRAFVAVSERIEPGWTEKQAAWEIQKHIRENGAEDLSFETIVAGGPWGAMPHAQPRDYVLQKGDMVVIDMGVRHNGYCSDLTRTIFLGKPDDKFKEIYSIVLSAQLTAEELIEAGTGGEPAHMIAHNVIEEAGYGDNFGHGLGHGVGLQIHEMPRLARTSKDTMEEGHVFTVEPGIYLPGWGGVRIEDQAVIENGKTRIMSHAPKLSFAA
ncbi:MAG: Xaa-Pro peptidase family protein [Dehalococcoidia bacterium]